MIGEIVIGVVSKSFRILDVGFLYFAFFWGSWDDLEFGIFRFEIFWMLDFFLLVLDFGFGILVTVVTVVRAAAVPKGGVCLPKGERVA